MAIALLHGHTSPETAYLIEDYPYGFRLRCKKRVWLEYNRKHGVRCVSQTSNPKLPGERWNSPKASTYWDISGALYLDDAGHVQSAGLSFYRSTVEAIAWRDTYGAAAHPDTVKVLDAWIAAKTARDAALAAVAA